MAFWNNLILVPSEVMLLCLLRTSQSKKHNWYKRFVPFLKHDTFCTNHHTPTEISAGQTCRKALRLQQASEFLRRLTFPQTTLAAVSLHISPDLSHQSSPSFPHFSYLSHVCPLPRRLWFLFHFVSCHLRAAPLNLKGPRGLSAWMCRALRCPDLDNMQLF